MDIKLQSIIKIQSWFRGIIFRKKRLPNILYIIQNYLTRNIVKLNNISDDGRINSCIDENNIIKKILIEFNKRVKKPEKRLWFDILVYDYQYGWLPVNIKSTTTETADNTGNIAMCVYTYTDEKLKLNLDKTYTSGIMSDILIKKIKNKKYNKIDKKDYYFIVINKINPSDIIINSLKGINNLTPNINNLPFQICWSKNTTFIYKPIRYRIKEFIKCIQSPTPSWKELFLENIRKLKIQDL